MPQAYHCAVISPDELEQLRSITDVVRLGRVTRLTPDEIVLEQGTIDSSGAPLYVGCSSQGIPRRLSTPVFDGDRITPQWVRTCKPTFSAAFVGHVEATGVDAEATEHLGRYLTNYGPAVEKLDALLGPL